MTGRDDSEGGNQEAHMQNFMPGSESEPLVPSGALAQTQATLASAPHHGAH